MDGAQRHDDRFILLFAHLKVKEDRLLRELAEVRREMDAVWRTAAVELRERQAAVSALAELRPMAARGTAPPRQPFPALRPPSTIPTDGPRPDDASAHAGLGVPVGRETPGSVPSNDDGPVPVRFGSKLPGKAVPPPPDTLEVLGTLGPVRDDKALPPAVDGEGQRLEVAGMPTGGADLAAARVAVQAVAERARAMPPGKGGRRVMSSRGLVPGEPMMPMLRNVLAAAGCPLTSREAALAMLELRGLRHEGPELVAVVNRVSALFGQEAAKGNMRRVRQEGTRAHRWETVAKEPPLNTKAHMRGGAKAQPKGSTG